jgi:uncharacterized membrane protein YdjX (TVP38/TMEM64 family)
MENSCSKIPWRAMGFAVIVTMAVIIPFLIWGERIDAFFSEMLGFSEKSPGVVALIIFSAMAVDVVLPIPSSLVLTASGMMLGLKCGFLVAFAALNVSCVVGYALGSAFKNVAVKIIGENDMAALSGIQQKNGTWFLVGMRPLPVLSEASLIFAGVTGYSKKRAIFECLIGNFYVAGIYAVVGSCFPEWSNSEYLAFVGAILISGILFIVQKSLSNRK